MQQWEYRRLIATGAYRAKTRKVYVDSGRIKQPDTEKRGILSAFKGTQQEDLDENLAELGSQGWELVSAVSATDFQSIHQTVEYLFKRPISEG